MSKFMQWMRQELEGIKAAEVKSNDYEVNDGEKVLGILADTDLQKLWVLRDRLNNQIVTLAKEYAHKIIEMAVEEARSGHNPATCEFCTIVRNHTTLNDKRNAIDTLFWTGLRLELSDEALVELYKAGGTIGLREDWKIVACRESKSSPLATLLSFGLPIPIPI